MIARVFLAAVFLSFINDAWLSFGATAMLPAVLLLGMFHWTLVRLDP